MFRHGHGHGHGHGQAGSGHSPSQPATGPRVLFASYGDLDLTHKVQQMFNTHRHFNVAAGQYNNQFGDPASGQYKDFVVLAVDGANKCVCHIAAENQPTNVSVQAHDSSPRTAPAHGSEILRANYAGLDVTAKCRDLFNHKGGLHFDRSFNEEFGDPIPGTRKLLVVVFMTMKGNTPHRACCYWSEDEKPNLTRDGHHGRGPSQHTPVHHPPHHQPVCNRTVHPAPGTGPRVLFATYGGFDVTHHVQRMYNSHHGKLSIPAGQYVSQMGSDPFPGQMKDFVVMTVDKNNHSHVHIAADNQPTHIDGSAPQQSTPHNGPPPSASEIIQANYGGADVTAKCKDMFNKRHGLRFDRSMNETFGDTLFGVHKRLTVIYMTKAGSIPHRACVHFGEQDKPHIPHRH